MVEIETLIVLTLNAIIAGVACIPFGLACKKQKNLSPFFFGYVFLAIGSVLSIFQYENFIIQLISYIFYVLTTIFFFIGVFLEYYKIYIKPNDQNLTIRNKLTAAFIVSPIIIIIIILIIIFINIIILINTFIIIMLLFSVIMLFRIYLKTHSATKLFLLIASISAIIGQTSVYFSYYGIEEAYFFANIITTFFITLMLSSGFVALLEQKVIDTLKEKNDIKDRYSHDLGNILHTITMAYDLFKMEHSSQMKTDDLDNLIKVKINEASKLVKFIRNI